MQPLILVRHGEYVRQLDTGHSPESELSDLGRLQAESTGRFLSALAIPPNRIDSSTMLRAKQTAKLIAGFLPGVTVESSEDLCECNQSQIPLPEASRGHGVVNEAPGPSSAFQRLFQTNDESGPRVVVCHGNIICYFLARIDPQSVWRRRVVPNCSHTTIEVAPGVE